MIYRIYGVIRNQRGGVTKEVCHEAESHAEALEAMLRLWLVEGYWEVGISKTNPLAGSGKPGQNPLFPRDFPALQTLENVAVGNGK